MEALDIVLPIIYIIVGCALIWLVIELVVTVKQVRSKSMKTLEDLQPTIKEVQTMVSDLQPTVKKIDPLVDRATLTIDSVNLEILRVDEILEDVSQVTGSVTSTMDAVNNVTSAPMDMLNTMTKKVRDKLRPKFASDESVQASLNSGYADKPSNPIVDFADAAVDAAGEAYREQREKSVARKEERAESAAKDDERNEKMAESSERLADAVIGKVNEDTSATESASSDA